MRAAFAALIWEVIVESNLFVLSKLLQGHKNKKRSEGGLGEMVVVMGGSTSIGIFVGLGV